MSFLKYDSTIKVEDGYFCFHTITEFRGIDWKNLEQSNLVGKYQLNQNVKVLTEEGLIDIDKITYHGKGKLTKITFENGNVLYIPKKQELAIEPQELGDDIVWKKVEDIIVTDKIVTLDNSLTVNEIDLDDEISHIYSINFETKPIFYIQYDILVK